MVDLKNKGRKGSGRVAFLAHLEGIKKMIDAGHPLVSVFEEYEKKLSIKSGQFGKYVKKYIRNKPTKEKIAEAKEVKKENVAAKIRSDPNYVANTLKSDPNRKKEDLT